VHKTTTEILDFENDDFEDAQWAAAVLVQVWAQARCSLGGGDERVGEQVSGVDAVRSGPWSGDVNRLSWMLKESGAGS
jgi:hypothetical protein